MAKTSRFKVHQQLLSIGDDYWIENEEGQKIYKIDGKALRIRKTLILEDAEGNPLCKIQERMLRIKDTMEIEDADGKRIALVQKALLTPFRDRWVVKIRSGPDLVVQGNLLDHEYTIKHGIKRVAEISKKWFKLSDTYGVEVDDDQDEFVILTVAIAIDMMVHD